MPNIKTVDFDKQGDIKYRTLSFFNLKLLNILQNLYMPCIINRTSTSAKCNNLHIVKIYF